MENNPKDKRYELSRRFTPEVLEGGFTPVPNLLLEYYHVLDTTTGVPKTLNSSEVMLLIHLLSHRWDSSNPFPTFARLARRMGMSETSVRNNARSLEKKHLLKRIARTGQSNEYNLDPLLEKLKVLQMSKKKSGKHKRETSPDAQEGE